MRTIPGCGWPLRATRALLDGLSRATNLALSASPPACCPTRNWRRTPRRKRFCASGARHRYQPSGRLAALLLKITRNVCLDRAGRTEAEEWTEARTAGRSDDDPAAQAESGALAEAVRRAVGSLPEPSRTVFILSHYEGLSYADIAVALDCPLGTVASRKRLAVEALRRKLAHWVEGENTK